MEHASHREWHRTERGRFASLSSQPLAVPFYRRDNYHTEPFSHQTIASLRIGTICFYCSVPRRTLQMPANYTLSNWHPPLTSPGLADMEGCHRLSWYHRLSPSHVPLFSTPSSSWSPMLADTMETASKTACGLNCTVFSPATGLSMHHLLVGSGDKRMKLRNLCGFPRASRGTESRLWIQIFRLEVTEFVWTLPNPLGPVVSELKGKKPLVYMSVLLPNHSIHFSLLKPSDIAQNRAGNLLSISPTLRPLWVSSNSCY